MNFTCLFFGRQQLSKRPHVNGTDYHLQTSNLEIASALFTDKSAYFKNISSF
jgi:hypothetical protein